MSTEQRERLNPSRPILTPLLASDDPTKRVGWTLTRANATTMQQREYLRRMQLWARRKVASEQHK
jgi:hypothetical protein